MWSNEQQDKQSESVWNVNENDEDNGKDDDYNKDDMADEMIMCLQMINSWNGQTRVRYSFALVTIGSSLLS